MPLKKSQIRGINDIAFKCGVDRTTFERKNSVKFQSVLSMYRVCSQYALGMQSVFTPK
jgi:hypothetical protein